MIGLVGITAVGLWDNIIGNHRSIWNGLKCGKAMLVQKRLGLEVFLTKCMLVIEDGM